MFPSLPDMPMQRQDFRCFHRLRVRWAEVDMQKIVFNAHYMAYADCAASEYWRALALPYEQSMQVLGGEVFLKKASVEYHASARLDDWLDIGIRCRRVGTSSMTYDCGVFAGDRLLAAIELVYVFADPATQTSRAVPPALRAVVEHFEAGGEVVELHVGDWSALGADASALRMAVFVEEQGIDRALELDEHDAGAMHAVVYNRLGLPLATGRLLAPQASAGLPGEPAPASRIGRMAVHRALRGQRLGHLVLDALVRAARERGDPRVGLHAQRSAEAFYRRAGFAVAGEPFDEVGIAHIAMELQLRA